MAMEMRTIRCHHGRATTAPCSNPAVVEVLGPAPNLLCAERYARYCEGALDALGEAMRANGDDTPSDDNPVLGLILEEAINYLECYELERARGVLEARGGRRHETRRERQFRELFERGRDEGGE